MGRAVHELQRQVGIPPETIAQSETGIDLPDIGPVQIKEALDVVVGVLADLMKIGHCSGQKVGHGRSGSTRGYAQGPESEDTGNPGVAILDLNQVHQVAAERNLVPPADPIHVLVEPEVREVQKHHVDGGGRAN